MYYDNMRTEAQSQKEIKYSQLSSSLRKPDLEGVELPLIPLDPCAGGCVAGGYLTALPGAGASYEMKAPGCSWQGTLAVRFS